MARRRRRRRGGGGGSGLFGFIGTLFAIIVIGAIIVTWSRANNITSITDAIDWSRKAAEEYRECDPFRENNCDWSLKLPDPDDSNGNTVPGNIELSPLASKFGNGQLEDYQSVLQEIPVFAPTEEEEKEIPVYDRSEWKHWTGSPCNTREQVLKDQGENVKTGDRCRVQSGSWEDPFTGNTVTDAGSLDIDHIVPLGYVHSHGGHAWDAAKKEEFANDPLNLRAVDAGENRSKGSQGPSDWNVPKNKDFQCEYGVIWVDVMEKYDLTIQPEDKEVIEENLSKC